jgi:arylsulfatase A-like enzyme
MPGTVGPDSALPAPCATQNPRTRVFRAAFFLLSRFLVCAFLVTTSAYCILAHVPFVYFGFLHPPLLQWVGEFASLHGFLYGAVLLVLGVAFGLEIRSSKNRRSLVAFLALNLVFAAYDVIQHGLSGLSPNVISYAWSMLVLFPLVWLAAIDMEASGIERSWKATSDESRLSMAAWLFSAFLVVVAFSVTAFFRALRGGVTIPAGDVALGFVASLAAHLLIFGVLGGAMLLSSTVAKRTPWPRRLEYLLSRILICLLGAFTLRIIAFPSISFEGREADIFCCVVSAALTIYGTATIARLRSMIAPRAPALPSRPRPKWTLAVAGVGLLAAAYAVPVLIGPADWDFVLQKLAVLAIWAAVIAFVLWSGIGAGNRLPRIWPVAAIVLALAGFAPYKLQPVARDWNDALDRYAGLDISFKAARAVLTEPFDSQADAAYYQFLKLNTNLSQAVGPAKLDLVSEFKPYHGQKPNIFIFVIDSLRQDYVSPYNPSVDFTPQIGKFAEDSVVLRNAFTRYGGTALSEPAIWAGVMLPHKQFVQPFYAVNNLQRLLDAEGYQSYISVDPILQAILRMSPSIVHLDEDTRSMSDYAYDVTIKGEDPRSVALSKQDTKSWSNLDLVGTLNELESKIAARKDTAQPIFVYTQPQNVHTLTVEESREGGSRRDITIHELRRVDAAFGQFIRFLQDRGLYDNSIIVVTADHGDAYGEFGRFGHADFLFPPVIRIPLIIHLPPRMRQNLVWDPNKIAFSIDVTPSLYYLLGQHPTLDSDLAGRPLFTRTMQEQQPYFRPDYLIASSYAPVYGLLADNGGSLFIVDAVNEQHYFYNLSDDPSGIHNLVTPEIRDANDDLIRRKILSIDAAYGVKN